MQLCDHIKGPWVCRRCRTRDHAAEPRNHHISHGHNRFNYQWP